MTRVARENDAINLAQGFPDFPAPDVLKEAACRAIQDDINQYAVTWGAPRLRRALEAKYLEWYGLEVDGDRELTVTCGATEAMAAVMMATINPGDEVVIFEPFYENFGPDTVLSDATPVFVTLEPPDHRIHKELLRGQISDRTRAIVLNSPNNPTGRVLSRDEMQLIADLSIEHDLLIFTDEIYEHIVYEGEHLCLACFPGMRDRTVVVSGASKTFSVTGWRVGTILAPPDLTSAIRKVHDFLTVGAAAPLQEGVAAGLESLHAGYYERLVSDYRARRDVLMEGLEAAGFRCAPPEGAYYVLADHSSLSDLDDTAFAYLLAREAKVASVPGSSFFSVPERGRNFVRFAFCKRHETLYEASENLARFARAGV